MAGQEPWRAKRLVQGGAALAGLSLVLGGIGYWWFTLGPAAPAPEVSVPPLDRREVARGRSIYQGNCAVCHGPQGEGAPDWREQNPDKTYPPPPHDSTGHTWHHGDGLLLRMVWDGGKSYEDPGFKSAMPAFGDRLAPEEIRAVLTYLKSLWGTKERGFQAEVSREDPFPK